VSFSPDEWPIVVIPNRPLTFGVRFDNINVCTFVPARIVSRQAYFNCLLWPVSATVYAMTAISVVAVVLGALMLGQRFTSAVLADGVMVIAAVHVGTVARPKQAQSRSIWLHQVKTFC
jgi:hypothetical protein